MFLIAPVARPGKVLYSCGMRVLFDQDLLEVTEPTLAAALDAARRRAETLNRVVVEATLDGMVIPDEALAAPSGERFESSEVRFITADPLALVRGTFRDVAQMILDTKGMQSKGADAIAAGELEKAMQHLAGALGAWDSVHQAVHSGTALLGLDPATLRVTIPGDTEPTVLGDRVQELAARLGDLKRIIHAKDWAGLSDALQYDMQDQADRWHVLLRTLAEQVGT